MRESSLYSIGHGNKEIEAFIQELKTFHIEYLVDVRSKPYSKWNPQFNQPTLDLELKNHGITYIYLGEFMGGLPEDKTCYIDGKVVYDLIKEKNFFKEGLERLITANSRNIKLAIMCSETKPQECHRSKLIGQELLKKGISLNHIVSKNMVISQETVINELTKGLGMIDLFGKEKKFTSRKKYE